MFDRAASTMLQPAAVSFIVNFNLRCSSYNIIVTKHVAV